MLPRLAVSSLMVTSVVAIAPLSSPAPVAAGLAHQAAQVATSEVSVEQLPPRRHLATKFGSTAPRVAGESLASAVDRQTRAYGHLGALRLFYPGLPDSWSSITSQSESDTYVVSFKAPPVAVVNGDYDEQLRRWFATAPQGGRLWWSYWHEPEDDIEGGAFTAPEYRAAWSHIADLAAQSGNRHLRPTLILMAWTAEDNSGRNWRDYYVGDAVRVIGWDAYNAGWRNGAYRDPVAMFSNIVAIGRQTGIPWGVSELGSVIVHASSGAERASWITDVSRHIAASGARFATYFDSDIGVDYRLHDDPSRLAWRSQVTGR